MRPATVVRLAVAGSRVDLLRMTLTAFGAALATLALLSALTVASIGADDGPYTSDLLNQGGLHLGVIVALVGLCVPVLVLLAQCSRIGAPARDRRLAAMRLGGATPGDVGRIVAAESGVGALAGSLLGAAVYFLLRVTLDGKVTGSFDSSPSRLRLPTDVLPAWWAIVVVVLAVPLLVLIATTVALRRVAFTPFGVSRRVRTQPPRTAPLVMLVVGVAVFFVVAAVLGAGTEVPAAVIVLAVLGGFVLAVVGLLTGQAAMTYSLGRFLARRTSSPSLLLAARRMVSDPFAATRATAVLTVAVVVAAGARHLRNVTLAGQGDSDDTFYVNAYDLVDLVLVVAAFLAALGLLVAAAEGIVARRRTYAAVVATGTPRAVVARAVLAEILLPLVPSLLLATIVGTVAGIGFMGRTVEAYDAVAATSHTVVVGVAWGRCP